MKLFTYCRSSAAYRVRVALHWKGLAREDVFVNLLEGEQLRDDYRTRNPQGLVPSLEDGDIRISQSLAILEHLEERYPEPPLLPADAAGRARVRQLALAVACEIHPLQTPRVLMTLGAEFGASEQDQLRWFRLWVERGLTALEEMIADHPATGRFCHGDQPSFADVMLIPQLYNARRRGCDLSALPELLRIEAECLALPAFAAALPEAQPDFPASAAGAGSSK